MNREKKLNNQYETMFRGYPDALKPEQLQEMLSIGRRKSYELLQDGIIFSVKMGRIYRIPKVAVIDYLCGRLA